MFESFRRNCARRAICKWGSCTSLLKGFIKIWLHYMKYIEIQAFLYKIKRHQLYQIFTFGIFRNEWIYEWIYYDRTTKLQQQNHFKVLLYSNNKIYKCYSPQLPEYLKFFSHVLSYTHTHINHFISNCCAIKWMNGKQIRNMRLLHNSILEYTQINDKWIHCIEYAKMP